MAEDLDISLKWDFSGWRYRAVREPFGFYEDIVDNVPINPLDLSTYTFEAQVRVEQDIKSKLLATFVVEIKDTDPLLGEIVLTLTPTVMGTLPIGVFYYDIVATSSVDNLPFSWVHGNFTVEGSVTKHA